MNQSNFNLHNTLSRRIEPFAADAKRPVRLYTCGPTVYNHAHIGNLRAYIFADLLKRALELNGSDVEWVMNITDVDDKTIANSIKEFGPGAGVEQLKQFTDRYSEAFFADLAKIHIRQSGASFVKVTEKIADIQLFILRLIKLGFAYTAEDGSTYFSIEKYQERFGDYGALVGEKFLEGKKTGARVKNDEYEKDNLSDFALWKAHQSDDGQIFWNDPVLGKGRPGWHIECTLINYLKFPDGTDIHTGGIDLIFPHHTNEIAQAAPVYDPKPFVRYWMHSEHILVDGKKMSKSLGNFYTLEDLENKNICSGPDLRYLILQSHYRSKLNVTLESLGAAKEGLTNIRKRIGELVAQADGAKGRVSKEYFEKFRAAINDDLNTPAALALVSEIFGESELSPADKLATIYEMDNVFGLDLEHSYIVWHPRVPVEGSNLEHPELATLIQARDEARKQKDFKRSDDLRKEIEAKGFKVLDTPSGTVIIPN